MNENKLRAARGRLHRHMDPVAGCEGCELLADLEAAVLASATDEPRSCDPREHGGKHAPWCPAASATDEHLAGCPRNHAADVPCEWAIQRAASATDEGPDHPEWIDLAADIRAEDGNHDKGAGTLAHALTVRGWTRRARPVPALDVTAHAEDWPNCCPTCRKAFAASATDEPSYRFTEEQTKEHGPVGAAAVHERLDKRYCFVYGCDLPQHANTKSGATNEGPYAADHQEAERGGVCYTCGASWPCMFARPAAPALDENPLTESMRGDYELWPGEGD